MIESEAKLQLSMKNQGDLPKGWIWTILEDVCSGLIGGGTPSRQTPEYFGGDIVWLTPTEIPKDRITILRDSKEKITKLGLQNSSAKLIPPGSVLLTSRATIGSVAINGCDVTTNQGFASFVCTNAIYNFYLAYWLWANKHVLQSNAKGTTFKEISKSILRGILLPLAPLPEQHRIVSKLEELFTKLDAGITALKKTKIQLKNYRQSILKYAFEGKLTEKWRKTHRSEIQSVTILLEEIKQKNKEDADNKSKIIPFFYNAEHQSVLPEGWIWTAMHEIIIDARYGTSKKCSYERHGTAILRIPNVVNGSISLDDLKFGNLTETEKKGLILRHGDLIVIRTNGSLALVGKSAIFRELRDPFAFASYLIRIRPALPSIGYYVNLYLQSKKPRLFIERNARTTAGQYNLNLKILNSILIPLPSVVEQNKIVEEIQFYFSVIYSSLTVVDRSIRQSERLRQGILMTAFAGKLVRHDPSDEPANILLERIKETKAKKGIVEKINKNIKNKFL